MKEVQKVSRFNHKKAKKAFQSEIAEVSVWNGTLEGLLETYLLQATPI